MTGTNWHAQQWQERANDHIASLHDEARVRRLVARRPGDPAAQRGLRFSVSRLVRRLVDGIHLIRRARSHP